MDDPDRTYNNISNELWSNPDGKDQYKYTMPGILHFENAQSLPETWYSGSPASYWANGNKFFWTSTITIDVDGGNNAKLVKLELIRP